MSLRLFVGRYLIRAYILKTFTKHTTSLAKVTLVNR